MMESFVKPIEKALLPIFKSLPDLPEEFRRTLVKLWPILALIFGVLQMIAAVGLWQIGSQLSGYANELSMSTRYGIVTGQLGVFYYVGLGVLVLDAIILLMAYPALNARKKKGWDLLFLAALLNVAYSVAMLFGAHFSGSINSLFGAFFGSAVGLYFLFQVREFYKV